MEKYKSAAPAESEGGEKKAPLNGFGGARPTFFNSKPKPATEEGEKENKQEETDEQKLTTAGKETLVMVTKSKSEGHQLKEGQEFEEEEEADKATEEYSNADYERVTQGLIR